MRLFLLPLAICLTACQAEQDHAAAIVYVRDPAFNYSTPLSVAPSLPPELSRFTYETEIVGYDNDGRHSETVRQTPAYALPAFGGHLLGGDRGEWGGELVFREANGATYRLLNENVHGIFKMPFGTITFTGLAHLGGNRGAIYTISQSSDSKIVTTLLHRLPGAPSGVFHTVTNDLVFRVASGNFSKGIPVPDCYLLDKSGAIGAIACSSVVKAEP